MRTGLKSMGGLAAAGLAVIAALNGGGAGAQTEPAAAPAEVCVTNACMPRQARLADEAGKAKQGWDACVRDVKAVTGVSLDAQRSVEDAMAVASRAIGAKRAAECRGFMDRLRAAHSPEEQRAIAEASGNINELRMMDGLPPLGPARIASSQVAAYSDDSFAPGSFQPTGYLHGGLLADGSFYYYRTLDDRLAAIRAGTEPPMVDPSQPPEQRKAAYQAWLAAHPNSSAR